MNPCDRVCAITVLGLALTDLLGEEVTLLRDGIPNCAIVTATDAAPCVGVAVRELRDHLHRMTGATIPALEIGEGDTLARKVEPGRVAVLVGASHVTRNLGIDESHIGSEAFVIRVDKDIVAIVGNDGPSYGANYRFMIDSAGTLYGVYHFLERLGVRWFYPSDKGVVIPSLKTVTVPYGREDCAPTFHYRHCGYGDFPWGRRISAGGDRDIWSTRHTCSIDLHKNFHKAHPDWFFCSANGEPGHQADLAKPEVVNAIVEMAAKRFSSRPPGLRYYLVIPLDGRSKPQDDARSKWVASAVVQVANRLRDTHPTGRVVYCAYNDYREPAADLERLPTNVVVLIAQSRAALLDAASRQKAYALVRAWQERRPEAVAFCRYNGGRLRMMPALIPHVIADDLKCLKALSDAGPAPIVGEMNFVGVGTKSPFSWWEHINEYVAAKLLWDPARDVDALLCDFCERFFGPAAAPMRAYLDECEAAYADLNQRDLFAVSTIDALEQHILKAQALAQAAPFDAHVAFFAEGFASLARVRTKLSAARVPATDPDAGLVAHFPFDEGSGPSTRDHVSGKACEIRNARWVNGVRGTALAFTAENSGVRIGPLALQGTDYTLEAWVRVDRPRQGRAFILGPFAWERQLLMVQFGLPTDQGHSGRLVLKHRRRERGENILLASAPFELLVGQWLHVVGTFSRKDGMAVYVNGQLRGLNVNLTKPSDMNLWWIGASGNGATKARDDTFRGFPGVIDEVRILRRELSAAEVQQRHEGLRVE